MSIGQGELRQLASDFPPAFKFSEVGDTVAGTIVAIRPPRPGEKDLNDEPAENYIFQLETDDGQKFSVWAAKPSYRLSAIAKAALDAGVDIKVGGRLAVKFASLGEPTKVGFNPPKLFTAAYKPPTAGVNPEDLV